MSFGDEEVFRKRVPVTAHAVVTALVDTHSFVTVALVFRHYLSAGDDLPEVFACSNLTIFMSTFQCQKLCAVIQTSKDNPRPQLEGLGDSNSQMFCYVLAARVECLRCFNKKKGHLVMGWRTAVRVYLSRSFESSDAHSSVRSSMN